MAQHSAPVPHATKHHARSQRQPTAHGALSQPGGGKERRAHRKVARTAGALAAGFREQGNAGGDGAERGPSCQGDAGGGHGQHGELLASRPGRASSSYA